MTENERDFLRSTLERNLNDKVEDLVHLLEINETRAAEIKVPTLTFASEGNGCVFVVNGSAHQMREHFKSFFQQRPEFRQVVQGVLDDIYMIDNR
ncbi:MAG: hypothetical protein ACI4TM_02145 [Candidatus Cryptobacteroides sp.]